MASTGKTGVTDFSTPTDAQVMFTRVVDAPKGLVYECYVTPKHIQSWLLGPPGWTMPVCEFDARAGGTWRYVWQKTSGEEMAMTGTVKDILRNEYIVTTERWGPEWPETENRVVFTESGGQTTVTTMLTYPSKVARDAALKTGMREGMEPSFARLDALVASLQK